MHKKVVSYTNFANLFFLLKDILYLCTEILCEDWNDMLMRRKQKVWLAVVLLILPLTFAAAQTDDPVLRKLEDMGYVNLRCKDVAGERVYTIENESYKLQTEGITEALRVIQSHGLDSIRPTKVILMNQDIPQVALTYLPQYQGWHSTAEVGDSWSKVKDVKKRNSSQLKVNLLIYPQLAFENLVITQIYYVLFDLSPTIEVNLFPGMKLSAMLKVPVYNDGYGVYEGKVHPGHITLSQRFRLPWYEIQGKLTLGYFNADRYGLDLQLKAPIPGDPRFIVGARLGVTGIGYWNGMKLHYDKDLNKTFSLTGSFYWPEYNTQFIVGVHKWLVGDKGVKFEMIRHFKHTSIGFYAMKATDKGASANGGFRFQVALPPYKNKRQKAYPRISTSDHMGIIYNAGNERYYYREYKAEASDNIMEANSFNPLFIQNYLNK